MRPSAFLEPFVSRKSRGTGHLASSCLQRNGHETVRTPAGSRVLFVSSSTIYSREQITRTSPTSSSNLFIYYFLFFEEKEKEKEARKTSAPPANHSWHTQTTQNSIQAHRCFELGEVRALGLSRHVYTFSTSREKNYQPFEGKDSIT